MSKGLSQVLALIVAASVLMMTALILIFMVQGGLGDIGQDVNVQGCVSAASTQCNTLGQNSISAPSSCLNEGEQIASEARTALNNEPGLSTGGEGQIECGE